MGRMLVNDIKIIFELYQPVGVKQLSDQPVAASGFRGKKPFFEKFQLFWRFLFQGFDRLAVYLRRCRFGRFFQISLLDQLFLQRKSLFFRPSVCRKTFPLLLL